MKEQKLKVNNLPEILIEYIKKTGIPKAELSRRCKISTMQLSNILGGIYAPRIETLAAIQKETGIEFLVSEDDA